MNTIQEFERRFSLSQDRLVGEGGFGKVYLSYDRHLDLEVAIKKSDVKSDERYNLFTEFKRISELPAHANIANYIACFRIKESSLTQTDFAVLQYYPLGNLKQLIKANKLSYNQKVGIIKGILSGLQFLHDNNIIHRDIKPPNILIAQRKYEETYIPKITDFGISRIINEFNDKSSIRTEFKMGQNEFTPPELSINKVPNLRPNADLYSAGMLIYFMLTEKMPFNLAQFDTPERREAELYQLTHKQFDPSKVLDGFTDLSLEFQNLLRRLLIIDPEQRLKTAKEALAMLSGEVNDNTIIETDDHTIIASATDDNSVSSEIIVEVEEPNNHKTENETWSFVRISNSITVLKEFISKYPTSIFVEKAKNLIKELENKAKKEDEDWNLALAKDKLDDYDGFLNKYPDSDKAKEAKRKIFEISDEIAWKKAKELDTEENYKKYLGRFKEGHYVNNAKAALLVLDGKKAFKELKVSVMNAPTHDKTLIKELLGQITQFQELFPDAAKELENDIDTLRKSVNLNRDMFIAFDKLNLKSNDREIAKFEKVFPHHPFESELKKLKTEIRENAAWKEAKRLNTINSYQNYIASFPLGKFILEATNKKISLEEQRLWNITIEQNTYEAYDKFINTYPDSKFSKVARGRLNILLEEKEWIKAKKIQYFDDFRQKFPNSKYIVEIDQMQASREDAELWDIAKRKDDITSYENYLKIGKSHLFEARERLSELEEERDWEQLHKNQNPKKEDYYQFINAHPSGKYVSITNNKIDQIKKEEAIGKILSLNNPIEIAEKSQNFLQYQESQQIESFYKQNDNNLWQYVDERKNKKLYKHYLDLYPKGQHSDQANERLEKISSTGIKKKKNTAFYLGALILFLVLAAFGYQYMQQSNDVMKVYKANPSANNLVNLLNNKVLDNPSDPNIATYSLALIDSLDQVSVDRFAEIIAVSNPNLQNGILREYSKQLEQKFNSIKTNEYDFTLTWQIYPSCYRIYEKWKLLNRESTGSDIEEWVVDNEANIKKSAFVAITNAESAIEFFKNDFCNSFSDYRPTYEKTKEIAKFFNDQGLEKDSDKILNACN